MQYRIEMSNPRKGKARIHLPGRRFDLAASPEAGAVWQVALSDSLRPDRGIVTLPAANASDAVWRVARAAIRAVSELTDSPIDEAPDDATRLDPAPLSAR
jgi:hypothetical protein